MSKLLNCFRPETVREEVATSNSITSKWRSFMKKHERSSNYEHESLLKNHKTLSPTDVDDEKEQKDREHLNNLIFKLTQSEAKIKFQEQINHVENECFSKHEIISKLFSQTNLSQAGDESCDQVEKHENCLEYSCNRSESFIRGKKKYYLNGTKLVRDVFTQTFNPRIQRRNIAIQTGNPDEGTLIEVKLKNNSSFASFEKSDSALSTQNSLEISFIPSPDRFYLVTIPLNKPEFIQRFISLKTSIIHSKKFDGKVYESLFCNAKTLHLTIALLDITTRSQAEEAKEILKKEFLKIKNFHFNLTMKGLRIWNDEENACRTVCIRLYNQELQEIVNRISTAFQAAGILKGVAKTSFPRAVPMHVTLMNSKRFAYRSSENLNAFNATPIIKCFGNWSFSNVIIDDIQFNFSGFVNQDGYYFCEYSYRNDHLNRSSVDEFRNQLKKPLNTNF